MQYHFLKKLGSYTSDRIIPPITPAWPCTRIPEAIWRACCKLGEQKKKKFHSWIKNRSCHKQSPGNCDRLWGAVPWVGAREWGPGQCRDDFLEQAAVLRKNLALVSQPQSDCHRHWTVLPSALHPFMSLLNNSPTLLLYLCICSFACLLGQGLTV